MVHIVNNVVKCYRCSSFIQYDDSDIIEAEQSYGVASYAGETYKAKLIICPKCGNKLEI